MKRNKDTKHMKKDPKRPLFARSLHASLLQGENLKKKSKKKSKQGP